MTNKQISRKINISYNKMPDKCPKCGNNNYGVSISEDDFEFILEDIDRKYECEECGFKWFETFRFQKWGELKN